MPAAAVIPAPIAYIKVVAVKKLVVGSRALACGTLNYCHYLSSPNQSVCQFMPFTGCLLWPVRLL